MSEEIILTGRMTSEIIRKDNFVHRSMCANSSFVHNILNFLEKSGVTYVPRFLGIDGQGREIIEYMNGYVPENLGCFTLEQCILATRLIKDLHIILENYPDCPDGLTVCHNDLSPCNFVFADNRPIAIIDWDAASFGNPLDDLAYAVWMWLDIGNDENSFSSVKCRADAMLDIYGVTSADRAEFAKRILNQMARVSRSIFPTDIQTHATRSWAEQCQTWFKIFLHNCNL